MLSPALIAHHKDDCARGCNSSFYDRTHDAGEKNWNAVRLNMDSPTVWMEVLGLLLHEVESSWPSSSLG